MNPPAAGAHPPAGAQPPVGAVGVVCALAVEARPLAHDPRLLVRISGMGGSPAARAAQALIDAGATALVSWGLAGGLDPDLAAGALFLPDTVIGAAGATYATDDAWRRRVATALASHHPVTHGRLLTSPQAIARVSDKAALHRDTGAAAVDMECLEVAALSARHHLPFIAVKVIIDGARDALPRAAITATDAGGSVHIGRLLGALATAPADLAPLMRLALRYRSAGRTLAAVARSRALAPPPVAA